MEFSCGLINSMCCFEGDGEVITWGEAKNRKTGRSDQRATFVPWKADLPVAPSASALLMGSGFIVHMSVGSHHAIGLTRTGTPSFEAFYAIVGVVLKHCAFERRRSDGSVAKVPCRLNCCRSRS